MDSAQFKQKIRSTFDDVSERYDQSRFFSISAKRMSELVPAAEKMRMLDVSTGTGAVAMEVARKYPQANIEAVDLSPGMLEQAKNKAQSEGVSNIVFSQCDAEDLPHDEGVFDVVTCGYGVFFYPDMEAAYQLICKKIKPGGTFIFSSFTKDAFNPYAKLFLRRLEKDYAVDIPNRLTDRLKTKEKMAALASLSRPRKIEIETHCIRYPISVGEWWSLLNNAGYKSLLEQLNSDQLIEFKREHLAEVDAIAIEGSLELNTDTLFGVVRM